MRNTERFWPTINRAAEDLSPQADGSFGVPRLRVDADETCNSGNREECQHRHLWTLVSWKNLYIKKNRITCKVHWNT